MNPLNLKKLSSAIPLIICFISVLSGYAQKTEPVKSNQGEIVTLHSSILKEERRIMIYSPKDSANLNISYPVVYVLDAENNFNQMVEFSKFFGRPDVDVAPPFIVVGITHRDRINDLSPTEDTAANSHFKCKSGGNELFLNFIEHELIPYVNLNYKTQTYRILAGHSLGGIATLNCMINHPSMFSAYIAASPSFWWDKKHMLKLVDEKLKSGSNLSKALFFSDGNEGTVNKTSFHSDIKKFDSLLRDRKIAGLDFKYVHYPEEDHNTVPIKSYFDGLRFIHRQFEFQTKLPDEEVNAAIVMKHFNEVSAKFGYTVLPSLELFLGWGEYLVKNPKAINNGISLLEMNTINYPSSSKAFAALGAAYLIKGKKEGAITAYKTASKLNPASEEIKLRLKELEK